MNKRNNYKEMANYWIDQYITLICMEENNRPEEVVAECKVLKRDLKKLGRLGDYK
jgi:hypothetical protein